MGTLSHPHRHGPLALGALVLVICALVAATFDGPRPAALGGGDRPPASVQEGERYDDRPQPGPEEPPAPPEEREPWLPWLPPLDLLLIVPAALVFGVALVVVARLRLRRRQRRLSGRMGARHSLALEAEPPPEDDDARLPDALGAGRRTIGEGSPRNAIVAAWVRLEQAVEGDRFPHRPEETPSELVERALASYRLDADAIGRLAALYREARFSRHPVTEEHRAEAAACLRRLLATLGSGAR